MSKAFSKRSVVEVPLGILVLEDEPEIAEDIERQLKERLSSNLVEDNSKEMNRENLVAPLQHRARIHRTDNLEDARNLFFNRSVDLLIADYKVKLKADSGELGWINPFLREIRNSGRQTVVIGQSAYTDELRSSLQEGLVQDGVSKKDPTSTLKVVDKGVSHGKELFKVRDAIFSSLYFLNSSASADSPIDKQVALDMARNVLADVDIPVYFKEDYSRSLVTLACFLNRLSSVPSVQFKLGAVTPELVDMLQPCLRSLASSSHSFEKDTRGVIEQLESRGYEVAMRVDI